MNLETNFGVFIRSVGERTEELCFESVAQHLSKEKIHLLHNFNPSYKAFFKMFEIAKEKGYDWYLGLDADVVLKRNWPEIFVNRVPNALNQNGFRVHFCVNDFITNEKLIRGNNWYNGNFTKLCIEILKKNIRIGKYWPIYKLFNYSSGYFTKPETSIRTTMFRKYNVPDFQYSDLIGFHGYEQYYAEIFRQYFTRFHREHDWQSWENRYPFLMKESVDRLFKKKNFDHAVANLGWNKAKSVRLKNVDARKTSKLALKCMNAYGIEEKPSLNKNLMEFYKEIRNNKASTINPKIHIK